MMPARSRAQILLAVVVLWAGTTGAQAADPAPTAASPVPTPAASPAPTPTLALPFGEIAPAAQTALGILKNLEPDDAVDQGTATVRTAIWDLNKGIDQLRDQSTRASVTQAGSLDTLRDLQSAWKKTQGTLTDRSATLGDRGRALEAEAVQVKQLEARWKATRDEARKPEANVPAETLGLIGDVLTAASATDRRIKFRQTTNLYLQNDLGALISRADAGENSVAAALDEAVKTLFVRDSPPIWDERVRPQQNLAGRWKSSWSEQVHLLRTFVIERKELLALHAAIFAVLLAAFLWMRRGIHQLTEDDPHLKRAAPIFDVPVAAALALSFVVKGPIYDGGPILFKALLRAAVLVPTVIMLRRLLDRRLYLALYALVVFYALDQVRAAATGFPVVTQWLFCAEMAGAIGIFAVLLRIQHTADESRRVVLGKWMPLLDRIAIAVLASALAASILGYVRLGTLLGNSALTSSYLAVFLYALLRVVEGLTFIALRVRPINAFRIARRHREQVQTSVYRVVRIVAVVFWVYFTLDLLQLRSPLFGWAANVLGHPVRFGSMSLALGQVLSFAAAIWFSVWVSRLIRFFLDEEVYERVQLSPGLPYAISTILNYSVLLVGFLVALGLLGVDLTKITIVAGAFSVGLGFGLQNIINNFVSGVILLFERPVKVGDVIQIGDSVGEVRRIGIRASIIRTRDGSDIIMPNGNLISNQVTNWTYADRCRAVEIAFNVAAGTDPAQVLALLKHTADALSTSGDRPASQVYITGITATGLSLNVRAWTTHYEDWVQVRSDLSAALLATLTRENIRLV